MVHEDRRVNVIDYWSAVERFNMPVVDIKPSGGGYQWSKHIHNDEKGDRRVPWITREIFQHKYTPNETKIFNIFVGFIEGQQIVDIIINCFPKSKEYHELSNVKYTSLINFQVNEYGEYIRDTIEIPDFLTYLACLKRRRDFPNSWLNKVEEHKKKLEEIFYNMVSDLSSRECKSLTYDDISQLFVDILVSTGLEELIEQVRHIAYINCYKRHVPREDDKNLSKEENEKKFRDINYYEEIIEKLPAQTDPLFSSFYLQDLALIKNAIQSDENIGKSLAQYLSGEPPGRRYDFISDVALLEEYSSPAKMTPARWPNKGSHPLSIAQQIAVNVAASEDKGILSVNGPPGTGKTTLLRDIVVDIAVKKAERMLEFYDPSQAFEQTNSGSCWRIDDKLKGLEIVLASNNNNAVENISKELPRLKEVEQEYNLEYFSDVATAILGEKAWGVCAAALGSKNNCVNFLQKFWVINPIRRYDEKMIENEYGLRYLLRNIDSDQFKGRKPNWNQAKQSFKRKLDECNGLIADLKMLDELDVKIAEMSKPRNALFDDLTSKKNALLSLKEEASELKCKELQISSELDDISGAIRMLQPIKPGSFIQAWETIFGGSRYSTWLKEYNSHYKRISEISKAKREISIRQKDLRELSIHKDDQIRSLENKIESLENEVFDLVKLWSDQEFDLEWLSDYPRASFWSKDMASIQLSSPWMHEKLHKVRGELFSEAMNLTKAFIIGARIPIIENMDAVVNVMTGYGWKDKKFLSDLWASFFLVVPLASTTFASFSRMFDGMHQDSLGHLLIDEAGQATVQSAAGAIFRSKRVIAVGDPMQVEPVVTIPKMLNDTLLDYYKIPDQFSVTSESVQKCSDRINKYGGYIGANKANWVGCPLRVHRRCLDPMFSLSNHMAYSGMMVYSTAQKKSAIDALLTDSIWIDVQCDKFEEHWSRREGMVTYNFIRSAIKATGGLPSLYVISPFRKVARSMRRLLNEKHEEIQELLKSLSCKEAIGPWINNHIGTIHQFQGKQADVTVILLGGNPEKTGAFTWASGAPNILNVAITRAKKYVVVIGNRDRWSKYNYFNTMAGVLVVKKPQDTRQKMIA